MELGRCGGHPGEAPAVLSEDNPATSANGADVGQTSGPRGAGEGVAVGLTRGWRGVAAVAGAARESVARPARHLVGAV